MIKSWRDIIVIIIYATACSHCFAQSSPIKYSYSGKLYCIFAYRDTEEDNYLILHDLIGRTSHYYRNNLGCNIDGIYMRNPYRNDKESHYYIWDDGGPDSWMTWKTSEWSEDYKLVHLTKNHLRRNEYSDHFFYSTSHVKTKFKTYSEFMAFWEKHFTNGNNKQ